MTDYKDYGYNSANFSCIHTYLLHPMLEILSRAKGRTILDLGCGNGWLTNYLIEKGYDVYGIDASVTGIEIAQKKNPTRFFLQDFTKGTLPAELRSIKFNTIVSTEVIEHVYDPRGYIDNCKNILASSGGGELILSTPYHGYLKNLALSITGKMDHHFTALWDGGHIKFWSVKTITALLKEKGFQDINFVGCGRIPYLWKTMIVSSRI